MVCSIEEKYNSRFIEDAFRTGYPGVDWKLAKAMVWVESGGPKNPAWNSRVMQIGNSGDPAHGVLKSGTEGSSVIMTDALWQAIKTQSIDQPVLNIRAGIAYLFTRMAYFATGTVRDSDDTRIYVEVIRHGDSLEKIARRVGTTVEILASMRKESTSTVLRVGEKLQYYKASQATVIQRWRPWDYPTIADRYNGGGDPAYAEKLEYVHTILFPKLVR